MTFRQAPPPGWTPESGKPRVGFTVDTEGLFCQWHKATLTPKQLVPADVALQVDTWFVTRHLGRCAFEETAAAWEEVNNPKDPEANDTAVKQLVKM